MKYLIDTNICIFLMKGDLGVLAHFSEKKAFGIGISSISASELLFGVHNSTNPGKNRENLINFLIGVDVLDYGFAAADAYGEIRASLRRKGTPVGELDMLIAAHAKSEGLTLVTNNTREFSRIEGLSCEDWLV
ncbi:MAG: type II toxin-antitoxin system VapC family toxin [Clostridiales Family XIII bacterium]|jgi:tRNA(fMet)-specific endonuclease VapC|nr:type II toxin-antitoxin system VapC family toxin [Clostridiales Family XIII bacterium]